MKYLFQTLILVSVFGTKVYCQQDKAMLANEIVEMFNSVKTYETDNLLIDKFGSVKLIREGHLDLTYKFSLLDIQTIELSNDADAVILTCSDKFVRCVSVLTPGNTFEGDGTNSACVLFITGKSLGLKLVSKIKQFKTQIQ